ncbi:recombinase family protein [Arthrobacter sp. IA7]|uniref:recombinase family protein n=1 Tax=Arthrobacter ipis TaxID=2716202 RepID=UPI001684FDCE|nr:recombinase family protein [Arthrobacter ipis]MBD1542989.1 recombinase family protein [Arthrobacter ipis]
MEPDTKKTKAVGYLRQSKRKLDSISFDIQQSAIEDHCRRNNLELVAVHGDQGISGLKGVDQRPGMQAALEDLKTGKASVLVVWKFSRVSRNRLHQAMILQELKDLRAGIQAATEPIDTSSAAGQFGMDVLLSLAQMEATQRAEVWKESHNHRLRRGLHPHHRQFFGYDRDKDKGYIPNADAELVREAYRKYIAGAGFKSIAYFLQEAGSTQHGRSWMAVNVQRMLDNPVYSGKVRFGGEEHAGAHEAIISEDTWAAYRKARADRASVPPRTKSNGYWLSGVIFCGSCGSAMGVNYGGKKIAYRMCNARRRGSSICGGNSIQQDVIDDYVALYLYGWMERLAGELPSEDEALEAARSAVATAEVALDAAKKERAGLQLMAVRLSWTDEEVKDALVEVARSIQDAQDQLDLARANLGGFRSPQDDLGQIQRGLELLGEGQQGTEQWNAAVKRTVGRIVIAPKAEGLTAWERISVVS